MNKRAKLNRNCIRIGFFRLTAEKEVVKKIQP